MDICFFGTSDVHAELWRDRGTIAQVAVNCLLHAEAENVATVCTCLFGDPVPKEEPVRNYAPFSYLTFHVVRSSLNS